ncbi:DUF5683 domain-containing protein [Solitalea lacus]|uniref:DUF5683 domain-containing protein n=1 Tax=Solitalea lacus TaxID=2911172 RepID=UPI001EDC89F4|nr:DUF5683 domain-containing protein [Solitalea lacus]UKJ06991.1 DUF5683 domain-containing protein [Solitalea lacus]
MAALLVFIGTASASDIVKSNNFAETIILTDTVKKTDIKSDTAKIEPVVKKKKVRTPKDPNTALFRAAVVPGLGQIYNKRYWKLPLVYGGFVALGYAINFNQDYYNEFLNEYIARTDNDPNTIGNPDYSGASDEQIVSVKNFYKRNRDICIIGTVALYAAQIIDAYVDAELSNFDVSDDLSLKISPTINQSLAFNNKLTFTPGISFRFTLKK